MPRVRAVAVLGAFCWLSVLVAGAAADGGEGKDLGQGWKETKNEEGKVVQQLKIEAPAFTEEDQYGYNMPSMYKCDACKAVIWHLDKDLRKVHPRSRRMKQWEYTDVFDETCRAGFEGYGVKLINGENTLSGPGLKHNEEQLAPGSGAIQMGGETWNKRLGEICRKIVYEGVGEEETYERFYSNFRAADGGGDIKAFTDDICYQELGHCHVGPKPPPKAKEDSGVAPGPKASKKKSEKANAKKEAKKAEAAKKKRAKAEKAETSAKVSSPAAGADDKVDVQTFLRSLAERHGVRDDEYLASRTTREWENMVLSAAGRIFSRKAEEPESCSAKR